MSEVSQVGAASPRALGSAYRCRRYEILFYTLLLTMMAGPLVAALDLPGALLEFLLAANLLAAVMPIGTGRGRRVLVAFLAVLWLARAVTAWFGHPAASALTLSLWALLAMFAAGGALRFAMRAATVDAEHMYAALSAYLLAGIFFGIFYWVLEYLGPGTFTANTEFSRMSAIYFSFVTLATLGYGDIVPRTDVARGLAIVEGVGGQLFLAVLVARLVSLYGRERAAG
jgi:voltage-gated potassium channel Kch